MYCDNLACYNEKPCPLHGGEIKHHEDTAEESDKKVRVLIAVDEEPESEFAVHWALTNLTDPQYSFTVLHAYDWVPIVTGGTPLGLPYVYPPLQEAVRAAAQEEATAVLKKFSAIFKAQSRFPNLRKCVAQRGPAKDIIVGYAHQHKMDLLVIGSRGLTGLSKWFGSVSYSLLHSAPSNLLILRPGRAEKKEGPRRITIAVDTSAHSEKAVAWVRDNVLRSKDAVTLVLARSDKLDKAFAKQGDQKDAGAQIEDYLGNLAKQIDGVTGGGTQVVVKSGEAKEVILEAVDKSEHLADLLVMGSRGQGAIKRAFVGSVVDYCAAHTSTPLLVVP